MQDNPFFRGYEYVKYSIGHLREKIFSISRNQYTYLRQTPMLCAVVTHRKYLLLIIKPDDNPFHFPIVSSGLSPVFFEKRELYHRMFLQLLEQFVDLPVQFMALLFVQNGIQFRIMGCFNQYRLMTGEGGKRSELCRPCLQAHPGIAFRFQMGQVLFYFLSSTHPIAKE